MSDLTPERRADLRMLLGDLDAHLAMDPRPSTAVPFAALFDAALPALPTLLDAADERDKLAAAVERVRALHSPRRAWGVGAEVCASCSGDEFALHPCDTLRALATGTHPQAACPLPVGDRPYWMSEYQWDPCACILLKDHDGPCECSHTTKEN